uniref:Uncharacterized protein n=1 Tax=Anguilla anguilla TaxID=7936 RepID=A0A0E9UJP3_ANGAN
MKLFQCQG